MRKADRLILPTTRTESMSVTDTVSERHKLVGKQKDTELLMRCEALHLKLDKFRKDRARTKRYAYDDQWSDYITVNGRTMTQKEYLMKTGNVVLQSNQIKGKFESIIGLMVSEQNEPVVSARAKKEQPFAEVVTAGMVANCRKNKIDVLSIMWMQDILAGGLMIGRESYDRNGDDSGRADSWTSYVNPNYFFVDSGMTDPTFKDATLIGQIVFKSREELLRMFARSEESYRELKKIYPTQFSSFKSPSLNDLPDKNDESNLLNFDEANDPSLCKLFEVWTLESRARIRLHDKNDISDDEIIDIDDAEYREQIRKENLHRREMGRKMGLSDEEIPYIIGDGFGADEAEKNGFFYENFWYCKYLAPDGTILWEGESPFADKKHPFTVSAIPFIDGMIVGHQKHNVDHNIAINRALILNDWLQRVRAKGVTVVPKSVVPDDVSYEEFAESWTSIDDIVYIEMKPGQEGMFPKTFYSNATTFPVSELISTIKSLMDNSDSVNGAMQGKTPLSGTSASLYAQQTSNATMSLSGLMKVFHTFLNDIGYKKMKNLISNYTPERWIEIAGRTPNVNNETLDFSELENSEFDFEMAQSSDSPSNKRQREADLRDFLARGLITMDEFLELTSVQYAEKLKQLRQARQQNEQEEAAAMGIAPPAVPIQNNYQVNG